MKKSVKRILCGALSLMMTSSLVLERALSLAEDNSSLGQTTTASATFKNVTGKYDTTKLMESYFNNSVIKSEETAPVYETRTVVVTLSGKNVTEKANGKNVADYLSTPEGERTAGEIDSEQDRFLMALSDRGIEYTLERTYNTVLNGVAIEIDTEYVSEIKRMKGVESVVITTSYSEPKTVAATSSGEVVTNETNVYKTGIYDSSENNEYGVDYAELYGAETVVAVLDTGLDYTHPAFQGFETPNVAKAWDRTYIKNIIDSKSLAAEAKYGALEVSDVYVSDKVPFAFDYADDDADVYPSYSNHGTHVAGIIGGYDTNGYTDKDGNLIPETFKGVVPDAQLAIFKVFTDDLDDPDLGGAVAEDIIAALDDCVKLNVDVINMSLGTSCGFSTTNDGDDEGKLLDDVYNAIQDAGIGLVCAASNDYSSGYGGVYGTNLATNPDSSTVGSPSTFAGALSVASVNGQQAGYMIANEGTTNEAYAFYEESRDINGNPFEFAKQLNELYPEKNGEFEYVIVPGVGQSADYNANIKRLVKGRIALVKRGKTTFQEKVELAMNLGAIAVIVYNNVAGVIRMNLGEIDDPVPAVSVNMNAGNKMAAAGTKTNPIGKVKIDLSQKAGPFMSEFSSWGPTHDLKLKPEITAHGGEITSTVPGGYGEQSGTSMASPNMAGFMALVRSYVKKDLGVTDAKEVNRLAMQLVMSTATTAYDQDDKPYSPRKQGAGLARMERVISGTKAYLSTDSEENDNRPKLELGDDVNEDMSDINPDTKKAYKGTGVYKMSFKVKNFGNSELKFTTDQIIMTETLSIDKLTVNEQAYILDKATTTWSCGDMITVAAGEEAEISVTLKLDDSERRYIEKSFANGMYVEGYLKLISQTAGQCDLSIPFLAFYGNWQDAPMLDYTAFEIAANEQDASVKEEDKIKASVWATQPYTSYYNEKYILPMGGYVYLLPEDDDPVYVDEAKCSVSRYNIYHGEGVAENYLTSTSIKAVYAGLLRNARIVKYRLYDDVTGELILEDVCNRVGKAYAGGGSGTPANVELELSPEEKDLIANGKYRMEFDFFMDDDGTYTPSSYDEYGNYIPASWEFPDDAKEENTYEFTFTVDYEAPIMEDVRVRYYNYKENNKTKQRIYLDVDVYDNHYAQALMLCYPKVDEEGDLSLMLATDFPTPIRNAKPNGTTTVSIEITDIYKQYGGQLYVQLDDYAVNSCLYEVNITEANKDLISDVKDFDFITDDKLTVNSRGEAELTLDIYETYKVELAFEGKGDESNFVWNSDEFAASVRNGEIVGLATGESCIYVSSGAGETKVINVTVTDKMGSLPATPTISFGLIKTDQEALSIASGNVKVNAGETFQLTVNPDPWYHPMTDMQYVWKSTNEQVASVDEDGNVTTHKKGMAVITATIQKKVNGKWESTRYATSVTLRVQNEFTVTSYNLTRYKGPGYNAWRCPTCDEIWAETELETVTVGTEYTENCCPDCYKLSNNTVVCVNVYETTGKKILKIPTDMNVWYIAAEAFKDNNNIETLILPSTVIDIRERAFQNCTALEEVYFVNMKPRLDADGNVVTYANGKVIDWADVAMMYENVFDGCTNLKKVDLSNVKTVTVAQYAFANCPNLSEVVDMPSIGTMHHYAFAGTALTSVDLTGLHMSGDFVFAGCTKLTEIITGKFTAIGNNMFSGCTELRYSKENPLILYTPKIGNGAFASYNNSWTGENYSACINLAGVKLVNPDGEDLEFAIGANAFNGCTREGFFVEMNGVRVRAIGDRAFANSAMTTFVFPDGLESLGSNVFSGTSINKLVISDGVKFEDIRFSGVPFRNMTIESASEDYKVVDGVLYNKEMTKVFHVNPSVTEVVLPDDVTEIGDYAFAGSKVRKLTLTANVTKIGVGAFMNSAIETVNLKDASITEIADSVFYGAEYIRNIELSNSVVKIGANAFANSGVNEFKANGLTEIGDRAFAGCALLKEIALADGIERMGSRVFENCMALTKVTLPSVKELGDFTFYGARNLKTVTFGDNATTVGKLTFYSTGVTSVTLPNELTFVDTAAFFGCKELTEIDLKNVTVIADGAFSGCTKLATVTGIENVEKMGAYAFYGSGIETMELTSAKEIGEMAFANVGMNVTVYQTEDGYVVTVFGDSQLPGYVEYTYNNLGNFNYNKETASMAYTSVSMPNVEKIGRFAFFNGGETEITLPESLKELGYGAFAASKNLTTIYENNEGFFVENNVLYRVVSEGVYEVVCYPAGLPSADVYTIKAGTARVNAFAFYGLNDQTLKKVVLPYTVKAIGDSAFFASGIQEYTFESIKAPVLETVFRKSVADTIESMSTTSYYKGYYYANFETYLFNYSRFIKEKSTLVMNYPANGTGYDNHMYRLYFGVKNVGEILPEDDTRAFLDLMNSFDVDEIKAWLTASASDETIKAEVLAMSESVKTARRYYNNASKKATQVDFVKDYETKLLEVEGALRSVKQHFGIEIKLVELRIAANSTHRIEYLVGETFDMTGLLIEKVYDDSSTEIADPSTYVLLSTNALGKYSTTVNVKCENKTLTIVISIKANDAGNQNSSSDSSSDISGNGTTTGGGCGSVIDGGTLGLAVFGILAAGMACCKKKKDE